MSSTGDLETKLELSSESAMGKKKKKKQRSKSRRANGKRHHTLPSSLFLSKHLDPFINYIVAVGGLEMLGRGRKG